VRSARPPYRRCGTPSAKFCDAVGDVAPAGLALGDVERYLTVRAHLAPGTRRSEFSDMRGFLRWLVNSGALTRDPSAGIRAPRVPQSVHRALSEERAEALLECCDGTQERLIVTLGLQLGLRRAEIVGLELGDIDLGRRPTLLVCHGKGGHQRLLPLTAAARDALVAYLAEYRITAGPLIRQVRYPERGIGANYVSRMVTRLAYQAGIKVASGDGVSSHALRHTMASDVYLKTRDVMAVSVALGHHCHAPTRVYVRGLDTERLREAMEGRSYRGGDANG
jgi:integrase